MPSGLARQDGQVAGCLGCDQRICSAAGDDAGPVGGHPAQLLVIELDEHPGGQRVDLRQHRAGVRLIGCLRRGHLPAGDQARQAAGEAPVPAGMEVAHRRCQAGAQLAGGDHGGDRGQAEHGIAYALNEQAARCHLSGRRSRRSQRGTSRRRCSHREIRQELTPAHRILTALPSAFTGHGRGQAQSRAVSSRDRVPVSRLPAGSGVRPKICGGIASARRIAITPRCRSGESARARTGKPERLSSRCADRARRELAPSASRALRTTAPGSRPAGTDRTR